MSDYEVGNQVAYQKMRDNVVDWAEGEGDFKLEEYLSILMDSEESETAKFHNLQMIGLQLGQQAGEEALADNLYERILEADKESDNQVFGLSLERAEHAFYDMGYNAAVKMKKHKEE